MQREGVNRQVFWICGITPSLAKLGPGSKNDSERRILYCGAQLAVSACRQRLRRFCLEKKLCNNIIGLWPERRAFLDGLCEQGLIAVGGPFLDGSGAMLVMRVADADAARELLAPDPWCSDGRDVQGIGRIRPWTIFLDGR